MTGASDTATGLLLIFAPVTTLHLMKIHAVPEALPFLSYIGVFVLSVGMACFYGAWLARSPVSTEKLEVVWLLTAMTRGLISVFVISRVLTSVLEVGWITVAVTDGVLALVQGIGLRKGWLHSV